MLSVLGIRFGFSLSFPGLVKLLLLTTTCDDGICYRSYGDHEQDDRQRSLYESNGTGDHQGLDVVRLDELSKYNSKHKRGGRVIELLHHPAYESECKTSPYVKH